MKPKMCQRKGPVEEKKRNRKKTLGARSQTFLREQCVAAPVDGKEMANKVKKLKTGSTGSNNCLIRGGVA